MPLTTSLISYWKLDEASNNALDAHGSNDLTDNNTVTSATGKISTARQFTAANSEYLNKADNASLSTGDVDFTFAAWVYLDTKTTDAPIVAKFDFGTTKEYLLSYDQTNDRFSFTVHDGTLQDSRLAFTFGSPSTATWYHVVGWHDSVNNVIGIDVNASAAQTTAHTTGVQDSAAEFRIGSMVGGSGAFMNGRIDEAGFWKRVLTSQERTDLYNDGTGLAYPFASAVNLDMWFARASERHLERWAVVPY